jgi:hypothetical protein
MKNKPKRVASCHQTFKNFLPFDLLSAPPPPLLFHLDSAELAELLLSLSPDKDLFYFYLFECYIPPSPDNFSYVLFICTLIQQLAVDHAPPCSKIR